MITANMAFRINAYGDYGVANALGLISYRHDRRRRMDLSAPGAGRARPELARLDRAACADWLVRAGCSGFSPSRSSAR